MCSRLFFLELCSNDTSGSPDVASKVTSGSPDVAYKVTSGSPDVASKTTSCSSDVAYKATSGSRDVVYQVTSGSRDVASKVTSGSRHVAYKATSGSPDIAYKVTSGSRHVASKACRFFKADFKRTVCIGIFCRNYYYQRKHDFCNFEIVVQGAKREQQRNVSTIPMLQWWKLMHRFGEFLFSRIKSQ